MKVSNREVSDRLEAVQRATEKMGLWSAYREGQDISYFTLNEDVELPDGSGLQQVPIIPPDGVAAFSTLAEARAQLEQVLPEHPSAKVYEQTWYA